MEQKKIARRLPQEDDLFAPSEVAKLLQVGKSTIRKWAQRGLLKGRRIFPGSTHRRFERAEIVRFAREHNLPLNFSRLGRRAYAKTKRRNHSTVE